MKTTINRKSDMDFLRILSSLMVVLLHTCSEVNIIPAEEGFILNTVLNSLTRFCVPVFIMISGYFMLDKEKSVSFFIKRGLKLIIIMVCWSSIYLVYNILKGKEEVNNLKEIIIYLLTEPIHLWYFYALSALTLFTPALSFFARSADKKTYIYTLVLMILSGSILTMLVKENRFLLVNLITDKTKGATALAFPAYYLFGYYVKRFGVNKKLSAFSFILGALMTVAGTLILSFKNGVLSQNVLSFFSVNTAIMSMGIFSFFAGRNIKGALFINTVAPLTAGIYGIHMLILPSVYEKMSVFSTGAVKISAVVIITYAVSGIIVFLYRFIKKSIFKLFVK